MVVLLHSGSKVDLSSEIISLRLVCTIASSCFYPDCCSLTRVAASLPWVAHLPKSAALSGILAGLVKKAKIENVWKVN